MEYDGNNLAEYMGDAADEADWSRRIKAVKRLHGGDYPANWYTDVITSGLMDRTLGAGSSAIHVGPFGSP